jgi:hypothetical protein
MSTEEGDLAGAAVVADDAANDFCQTPAQKKKKGGRPLAAIKLHFNCSPGTKTTHNPTAVCKFCDTIFVNKKNDALEKHILEHCKSVSPEVRLAVQQQLADKAPPTVAPNAAVSGARSGASASSKRPYSSNLKITASFATATPFTDEEQVRLHHLLLRAMVDSAVSFRMLDSVHFRYFCDEVTGQRYTPPGKFNGIQLPCLLPVRKDHSNIDACDLVIATGSTQMRTSILEQEYAAVRAAHKIKLQDAVHVTMGFDGWSDLSNASVYSANAIVPPQLNGQRSVLLIDFRDVSIEHHNGTFLAGN